MSVAAMIQMQRRSRSLGTLCNRFYSLRRQPSLLQVPLVRSFATDKEESNEYVYESPLGHVVTRLRGVSLTTGIMGSLGLPLVLAFKGDIPSAGFLGMALAFVSGTLGSTAVIHFVFSPYVYTIERIPIRKCHYNKEESSSEEAESEEPEEASSETETSSEPPTECKEFLLKAKSKGLFLREKETVFDPATDLVMYQGMRPLCNLQVKGQNLYVHPEYVYDEVMQKKMNLKTKIATENPDDELF